MFIHPASLLPNIINMCSVSNQNWCKGFHFREKIEKSGLNNIVLRLIISVPVCMYVCVSVGASYGA